MKRTRRPEKKEFVERLRTLFGGQTVASVAKRLGIDQPAMTRYLRGEVTPGYNFFAKAARAGVDTNWLLTGQTTERTETSQPKQLMLLHQLAFQISQLNRAIDVDEILFVVQALVKFKTIHMRQ